jgi:ubiquinone/menaquinone biosynthesis C-methylase UbiE
MNKIINWSEIVLNYDSPTITKNDLLVPYFLSINYLDPILDVGCGTGFFAKMLSKKYKVIGLDTHNNKFIDFEYLKADAQNIPLNDSTVGDVLLINVFSCVGNTKKIVNILKESNRVKKENSKIYVINTPELFSKEEIESDIFRSNIIGRNRVKINAKKVDGTWIEFEDNVVLDLNFKKYVSESGLKIIETKDFIHPIIKKQIYKLWILQ